MNKKNPNPGGQKELVADELSNKLADLGDITLRKMFGGIGIFCDKKMFALVNRSGTAFLKTDSQSAPKFEELHSERMGKMPYHEIPESVLANAGKLKSWAAVSIELTKQS